LSEIEIEKNDPIGLSKEELETLFESTFKKLNKIDESKHDLPPFLEPQMKAQSLSNSSSLNGGEIIANKARSSLRIKYEAEIDVIKKTLGSLEDIRRELGLSKRKMAQLLLVDPSAWTRWTKNNEDPPPHVYRALQWFMILQEKHPELRTSVWLNNIAQPKISRHEIESIKTEVRNDLNTNKLHLSESIDKDKKITLLNRQMIHSEKQIDQLRMRLKLLFGLQIVFFVFWGLRALF
jgi:DNA-binding transcriptional regulator YiaG